MSPGVTVSWNAERVLEQCVIEQGKGGIAIHFTGSSLTLSLNIQITNLPFSLELDPLSLLCSPSSTGLTTHSY